MFQRNDAQILSGVIDVDACVEPVLSIDEAASHPHNRYKILIHYIIYLRQYSV